MNVSSILRGSLLLFFAVGVADARAAEKEYECAVRDNSKRLLMPTTDGTFEVMDGAYAIRAADQNSAQSAALALANKQHNNRAVSASCFERDRDSGITE